jgi:hypothetical protein
MLRRLGVFALVILLVPSLFLGRSSAHMFDVAASLGARKIPSGAVERRDRVLIVGRLRSAEPTCRQGKTVKLRWRRAGTGRARTLRTDQTDAEGDYRFKIRPGKTLRVFVRFDGFAEFSSDHHHICSGSRSRTLRIIVERA